MDIKNDRQNSFPLVVDPDEVSGDTTNHGSTGDRGIITPDDKDDNLSQPLPSSPCPNPGGDEAFGEELGSNVAGNERSTPRKKWPDTKQARHWCLTKNNYTPEDEVKFETSLKDCHSKGLVITAIIAKEIGESGTPHLQGYIHFKKLIRISGIHALLGYDSPCMHLSIQGKDGDPTNGKPPLAAFRYCMKEKNFYVVGKDLHEIDRLKTQTKTGTGRSSDAYVRITRAIETRQVTTMAEVRKMDAEVAARQDEYWKGLIIKNLPKQPIPDHPFRPWQEMLLKKLEEPPNDREVIFIIDKKGKCGKTWFTDMYAEKYGKCCTVGADKRENISYEVKDHVVEHGAPRVIFMDAPRARSNYVSSAFLEEVKNGKIRCPKYKSGTLPIPVPHMVVNMNEYPIKSVNDKGLSDDRYVYLVVDDTGSDAKELLGYRCDERTDFNNPLTPYNIIQRTIQSTLPDGLQVGINKAYKYYGDNPDPEQLRNNIFNAIMKWGEKMMKLND